MNDLSANEKYTAHDTFCPTGHLFKHNGAVGMPPKTYLNTDTSIGSGLGSILLKTASQKI